MPSFKTSAAVLATALFSTIASSQAQYTIDPNSVPQATRDGWCNSQEATCPLLCLQLPGNSATTESNTCDSASLDFDCVCGNGLSPNATEFSQTMPFFVCQEFGNQCVANCNGVTSCQSACRSDHPCGAQNPTRVNVTTTTSSASSTALPAGATSGTAGVVYNGLGGNAAASTTASGSQPTESKKSGAQMALDAGRSYGFAVVVAGLFAGFALVL